MYFTRDETLYWAYNGNLTVGGTIQATVEIKETDMELMRASNQWATRPDDERFWTIEDLSHGDPGA